MKLLENKIKTIYCEMCGVNTNMKGSVKISTSEGKYRKYNVCWSCANKIIEAVESPNELDVKVKYFRDMVSIAKINGGDWIDLRAGEDVTLSQGEYKLIPLGVGMILPDGYEAHVVPRSSTFKNFGIISANSIGIIDNSYSGDDDEWQFPAIALRDTHIKKGDRICQFRIVKNQPPVYFEQVSHLNNKSRGGIGSTGTK